MLRTLACLALACGDESLAEAWGRLVEGEPGG